MTTCAELIDIGWSRLNKRICDKYTFSIYYEEIVYDIIMTKGEECALTLIGENFSSCETVSSVKEIKEILGDIISGTVIQWKVYKFGIEPG